MTANIWNMGRTDMRMVQKYPRNPVEERIPTVEIGFRVSSLPNSKLKLQTHFKALTDKEVEAASGDQTELVSGIRARVGDIVLDNTSVLIWNPYGMKSAELENFGKT